MSDASVKRAQMEDYQNLMHGRSSQYLRHEACPQCGSKDNLARFDDGHGWCFGCRHYEPPTTSNIFKSLRGDQMKDAWLALTDSDGVVIRHLMKPLETKWDAWIRVGRPNYSDISVDMVPGKPQNPEEVKTFRGSTLQMPPEDVKPFIGIPGLQWLTKYGIVREEYKDFLWSEAKQWLVYPMYSSAALRNHGTKLLVAWQARNFNKERPKPKYYTKGPIGDLFHIIGSPYGQTLVMVEDIISALKVGRTHSAFSLFGSNIGLKLLTSLATRFTNLVIWLDRDKAQEGVRIAQNAKQLGFTNTYTIITDKDPKEYTDDEIKIQLQGRD